MPQDLRTVLYSSHVDLNAQMVPFGGWEMPLQYPTGIIKEHLLTRREAGLFDVSHMGRLRFRGSGVLPFLQHVLTNQASALEVGQSQYTLVPDPDGGAVDDAYLYRFLADEYLLVVNASNREAVIDHFTAHLAAFDGVDMQDITDAWAMISLQGPASRDILGGLLTEGQLPEPMRNALSVTRLDGQPLWLARTGYTGEPICFELFTPRGQAVDLWQRLLDAGAHPVGLGARDTLRLEAGLPLYGHEIGPGPTDGGAPIPIFASPLSRFAVSLSPAKGDFVGRAPLQRQHQALKAILNRDFSAIEHLPQRIMCLQVTGRGIARAGDPVTYQGQPAGFVTSGTMVPYWHFEGEGLASRMTGESGKRAIALALLDSPRWEGDEVEVIVRGRPTPARVTPYHLRAEAPPLARPILSETFQTGPAAAARQPAPPEPKTPAKALNLASLAIKNHQWRRQDCINLIPSEQTPSPVVSRLSILDPVGRYAEHKPVKAFCDADVFYYQGTDFIAQVEHWLIEEMAAYLGCAGVEVRPVSGQMANTALFSAMVDYVNRTDRKVEQRRLRSVMNHHIIKGGHLSAQPMGALRDFVARDPATEKPAVVNFPVLPDNPFQVDLDATRELVERYRPELVILGRSMTLHREPVAPLRGMIDELQLDTVLMYDMAHVLGLAGPHFQEPFREGADVVTGSTHKTFFGTQRGVIAADWQPSHPRWELWEAIGRRAFPGSVSNHHLGTLLGLLMAAMEMNAFRDDYQRRVVANAKAFAQSLHECGLAVAGDPGIGFTETHQVILNVGYAQGPDIARRLESNNIVVNYQAGPDEEGFTASGYLRMGVAEMTRFGMTAAAFQEVAQLIKDTIDGRSGVADQAAALRRRHDRLQFCFDDSDMEALAGKLHDLV